MFTRQHYVKVAGFIKDHRLNAAKQERSKEVQDTLDMVALDLAEMFEAGNPRFDSERFEKACGLRE